MSKMVLKALSPEEQGIVSNVASLLNQLLSGQAVEENPEKVSEGEPAGGPGAPTTSLKSKACKADKSPEDMAEDTTVEPESEEAKKALVTTESDAGDANADAEERVDETQPEPNAKKIDEVAKALAKILTGNIQSVKKSAPIDPTISALEGVSKVLKNLVDRQDEMESAFSNILTGLGITKQFEVAKSAAAPVQKGKPIFTSDNANGVMEILTALAKGMEKKEDEPVGDNRTVIRKNLGNGDVLAAMFGQRLPTARQ